MKEHFKQQIEQGATDQFFYCTENLGEVRIKRHRGTLESLPTNLKFTRMVESIPFFELSDYDEAGGEAGWSK